MNDPEMNTLVIQTATAAGLRVNVDGKMLNDNYTNVMGSFPSLVRFARALLARQPAAIDKQEPVATLHDDGRYSWRGAKTHGFSYAGWRMEVYAAPLANEASKPAAPSVGQDERELIELLRNVCHYADSVCGMLRQGGWPGKAEALESRIKAVIDFDANSRDKETNLPCPICNGVEGCDHTVPERARAASTSANVAQGAGEQSGESFALWFRAEVQADRLYGSDEEAAWAGYKAAMDKCAAPPAQTALTDDARDAARYRWLREQDSHDEYFVASGSNGTWGECGHYGVSGEHLDGVIDAALTAAQSASGDTI
jgi:hypothetical protein